MKSLRIVLCLVVLCGLTLFSGCGYYALSSKDQKFVNELYKKHGTTDLKKVIRNYRSQVTLDDSGIPTKAEGFHETTLLIEAVKANNLAVVKYFVSRGADVNQVVKSKSYFNSSEYHNSDNALFRAIVFQQDKSLEITKFLFSKGAKNFPEGYGNPFTGALNNGDESLETIKFFISEGAKIPKDSRGNRWTPLEQVRWASELSHHKDKKYDATIEYLSSLE